MQNKELSKFTKKVYDYYRVHKRDLAWRNNANPYQVVVSEIMLQQTQVDRVAIKYPHFLEKFPTLADVAQAPTHAVLTAWQGLGYNRRALALHQFAQRVYHEYKGVIPSDPETLETFKGIGPATAASIAVYAYNTPYTFIETNVRAVFIHHFFPEKKAVHDKELLPLVEKTLDKANPREWYYALMDYGSMLKKLHKNPSRKSAHYAVQSKFEGSDRQVRGLILRHLTQMHALTEQEFIEIIPRDAAIIRRILADMEREGFVAFSGDLFVLKS